MEDWDALCPGCFAVKGDVALCPNCGYDESERRTPLVLPHRTLLNNQFLVGKVLGKPGGFGITYLGWDVKLETLVAIKEYLPRELASRDSNHMTVVAHSREDGDVFRFGLEQFLKEARILARFDHPNVIRTRGFFEQNGTGYLVMDYLQGVDLAEYAASQGGRLGEPEAMGLMLQILDGLQEVHAKGVLHRDIKPQNIYRTTNGRPILLDFGAARQAMGERSQNLSVVLTPGFSPYEQYHRRGEQGPWTDIYAVAATFYYLLAGQCPPEATERVAHDDMLPVKQMVLNVSQQLSDALQVGMSIDATARPQDVFLFREMLMGQAKAVVPPVMPAASPVHSPPAPVEVKAPPPIPPGTGQVSMPSPNPVLPQYVPRPAAAQPVPPAYPPPSPSPQYKQPPQKKSSGLIIAGGIAAMVILVAGMFFAGVFDKKELPEAAPQKSSPAVSAPSQPPVDPAAQKDPSLKAGPEAPASNDTTVKPDPKAGSGGSQPPIRQNPPTKDTTKEQPPQQTQPPKKGGSLW